MTSPRFNTDRRRAQDEMRIFNALPRAIRDAMNDASGSVRASVVRDALTRGVSEAKVIETLVKPRSRK